MKPAVVAVAGLSIALGMSIALLFREPARKRGPEPGWTAAARPEPAAGPSRRTAIGAERAEPPRAAEPSARGVDPLWAQKNRDGIRALERGELAQAVRLFEECAAAVPHERVFQHNLAEALARLGSEEWDRGGTAGAQSAIARLRRASELAPEREDIARRLAEMLALRASEEGHWTESSGHFDLSYDGSRDDLAFRTAEILDVLEGAYLDLTEHFGIDPVRGGRARIRVVLYKRAGFHGATGIGHWAGGLYDGSIRVPLEDLGQERAQLRRVLRHELVHAFVHEAGGRSVPGWLNEGLAQVLEDTDPATQGRARDAARRRVLGADLPALEQLAGSLGSAGDEAAIGRAYATALLFVEFVAREHGDRTPFAMVTGCRGNGGPATAFERATGIPLAAAYDDFRLSLAR
ncbi:MAG: hypothetical protein JNK02_04790 [Planctomycetes bacterium]|nr:hypothetical protein [Planctomycetota bacterium]